MRALFGLLFALLAGAAQAQVTPGTSPLSGAKGGTANGFMQFTGPAASMKSYALANASGTIAMLNQVQTWTGAQSFTDGTLILLGATSGSSTLKAPATGGGTATLFPGSDTVMGVAAAQTPTNKTFNCANNTCTVRIASDVTGLGTGVATALGVNVGTAGAFVVNGGALGTPSSGTGTNLTGVPTTGLTGTLQAAQEPAHTGDCTNTAGSLALNCLQTNGVSFTPTATAAAGQLPGEPSTGSAAAGKVGEFTSNTCASAAITTGTQTNCSAGLSLTAGDWDVQAVIYYSPSNASTNMTDMYCSVSLTSAVLDQTTFNFTRISFGAGVVPGLSVSNTAVCPTRRVSVSSTTPVFAVAFVDFTVSTMNFSGGIRARRVR